MASAAGSRPWPSTRVTAITCSLLRPMSMKTLRRARGFTVGPQQDRRIGIVRPWHADRLDRLSNSRTMPVSSPIWRAETRRPSSPTMRPAAGASARPRPGIWSTRVKALPQQPLDDFCPVVRACPSSRRAGPRCPTSSTTCPTSTATEGQYLLRDLAAAARACRRSATTVHRPDPRQHAERMSLGAQESYGQSANAFWKFSLSHVLQCRDCLLQCRAFVRVTRLA